MLHTVFWASSYQKYLEIQLLVDDEKVGSKSSEDERGVGEQSHPPHPPDKNEHEDDGGGGEDLDEDGGGGDDLDEDGW